MSKFGIKRHCVVCGAILPEKSQETLIGMGFGLKRKDGGVIWHCRYNLHTDEQITAALNRPPEFMTAHKKEINYGNNH